MITEKTVFILGAGASCPYGYPDGRELRQKICSKFVNDSIEYFNTQSAREGELFAAVEKHNAERFVETFRKSSTKSIDLFLARNPEFKLMGKWAIIFRILVAEQTSQFRESVKNREQDWYSYLFQRLTDDLVSKEDYKKLGENDISFVTFNYDRSIEHFLYESLLNSFSGIGMANIIEQIGKLKIIHIFGQIAGLDWQDMPRRIEYGTAPCSTDIGSLVNNLKIIYEENNDPAIEEAHKLIAKAKRVFFLGFSYAKENLEILKIPQILNSRQRIYGTALNFTKREIRSVTGIFPQCFPSREPTVCIDDVDCLMLLREYL